MIKICDRKSKIKNLEIIISKAIKIQILNFFDLFFIQFSDILSHKTRKKKPSKF